ncbi:MAG TPA: TonB-dependent receptor plug domain-containing protein [Saprospiraceae bacterium]|nr:TonB-dependent receptor plug domain-containing protein [Saprospiraceae bacterium]
MQAHKIVFLIDDDSDDQEIFSMALEKANDQTECRFANDGIHALAQINADEHFCPDYIFIDMNMPRMNGQQCLVEIKKIERLKNTPVYMYSTSADPERIEENKRLGAADFIIKPSSIQDLINILAKIVQKPVMAMMVFLFFFGAFQPSLNAQEPIPDIPMMKKLPIEELMDVVVTSVSRRPENLSEVASAIQVISGYDITRSTATSLPEALRLAPNLQVAQSGSHDWGISARGFNGAPTTSSSLADKLLVMIDGRTVYTPLFAGVFWDVQNVLLEDIDRIEVVSGPGGTLWGSNAVNGVVNVITKSAKETQGLHVSASYGSLLRDMEELQYGGQIDSALYFRAYGQHKHYNSTELADGSDARNAWDLTQAGFRMDYSPSINNSFTLQGDVYAGDEDDTLSTLVNGQNFIGRWTHSFSEKTNLVIQSYFDRTWREIGNSSFTDQMNTWDLDVQQHFMIGSSHQMLLGLGYRLQDDQTISFDNRFTPANRTLDLLSAFFQDQIAIIPSRLQLTIGSKFLDNDYTGFEIQPSIRFAWTPDDVHTVWTAVSRAVRTPSRFDVDLTAFDIHQIDNFQSEEVVAYEMGYRMRPSKKISFSLATFYNVYDKLRSFNMTDDPESPIVFGNDLAAKAWGFEVSGTALISNWWQLRGGCTFLNKEFTYKSPDVFPQTELIESIDPKSQCILHSIMDVSKNFQVDLLARYITDLPGLAPTIPVVPAFFSMNARVGWDFKSLNFSVAGQNIFTASHAEFGSGRIPRSVYAKISLNL